LTQARVCGIIIVVQVRDGKERVCGHCGCALRRDGRFCSGCGSPLSQRTFPTQPDLPRYHKRTRRVITSARCSAFHHDLLVTVFNSSFCPECGRRLAGALPEPDAT
jgi:hypothetical protein